MKLLAKNKRARFDYEIKETLVAGLVLSGPEVKSAKAGNVSLAGSFVQLKDDEAWLTNAHINPYQHSATNAQPDRNRKLLLHRKQIDELLGKRSDGYSIVPLALMQERGLIKLEIGIGRGKKRYDKREAIKRRDTERDLGRKLKG